MRSCFEALLMFVLLMCWFTAVPSMLMLLCLIKVTTSFFTVNLLLLLHLLSSNVHHCKNLLSFAAFCFTLCHFKVFSMLSLMLHCFLAASFWFSHCHLLKLHLLFQLPLLLLVAKMVAFFGNCVELAPQLCSIHRMKQRPACHQ